jgi:hypothetical protein
VAGHELAVLRVADGVLRRRVEEVARVAHEVLVQLVLAADHHDQGRIVAAARAPRALVGRHPRAGVAVEHHGVEAAHVDAEFEGARRPDAPQVAGVEVGLDLAAAVVGERGLIRADLPGEVALAALAEVARAVGRVLLGRLSRPGERQRLLAHRHEVDEQPLRLRVARLAAAAAALLPVVVVLRRVPQHPVARPPARGVLVDERDSARVAAGDGRDVVDGVVDRRRTADELRGGVEPLAGPREPAQRERHLRAEHAPVAVDLVYHDVLQRREEPVPEASGVRQQRVVDHVGVREEHGRAAVPHVALLRLREPPGVGVDRDPTAEAEVRREFGQRLLLVGDQRVLRPDVQRPPAVIHRGLEGGDGVRE